MIDDRQSEITFDGLQNFLKQLGFDQSAKINRTLAFHHHESGTIVMVSIPDDGKSVRSADILSIAMRLDSQGLASRGVLESFRAGRLPLAS